MNTDERRLKKAALISVSRRSSAAYLITLALAVAALAHAADPCQKGATALQQRDLTRAEVLLKQCLENHPTQVEPYLMLCGVYQLQQNPEALYNTAREGVKKFSQEKRFYLTVATHDARRKRYQAAIETLEEGFRRWPGDAKMSSLLASAHFARGTELLDAGRNEAAAENLRRAVKLAPGDVEAHLNLGRALHNLLRNTEALAAFDRVLELSPELPLARFHRGLSLHTLGEFDRAIEDLTREIAVYPDYAPARLVRGLAQMANGEWTKALADLEIAAVRMPDNPQAHYARARALVQSGRLKEAETSLRRAIALDPGDPAPVNTLVQVLLRLGRPEEARPLARKAAELARHRRSADPGEIRFEKFGRPSP